MAKNQKLDEATKEAIRADVRNIKNSGETKKQIAERFNIHPTMISKIMQGATVKAKSAKVAKRKTVKKTTQSKNGTKSIEDEWEAAFNDWIAKRDATRAAVKAVDEAVSAEKVASDKLKKLVEQLR